MVNGPAPLNDRYGQMQVAIAQEAAKLITVMHRHETVRAIWVEMEKKYGPSVGRIPVKRHNELAGYPNVHITHPDSTLLYTINSTASMEARITELEEIKQKRLEMDRK